MRYFLFTIVILLAACQSPTPASTQILSTGTAQPSATAQESPEMPASTDAPVSTATPAYPVITQITEPGCCTEPFWSPDGERVLFIDQPEATGLTGIYSIPSQGGEQELFSNEIGLVQGRYLVFPDESGQAVVIQDRETAEEWTITNGGERVHISPDGTQVAWARTNESGGFDTRPTTVTVAGLRGDDPQEVLTVRGGGLVGWVDDDTLLFEGRLLERGQELRLFTYNLSDGAITDITTEDRVWSAQIAPGGAWLVYTVAFNYDEELDTEGVWIARTDGSERYQIDVIGSMQWRDSTHLLIIPLDLEAAHHRLLQLDVTTGEITPLTDPDDTPFKVLAGNWAASTDHIVYLESETEALHVMTLPPLEE